MEDIIKNYTLETQIKKITSSLLMDIKSSTETLNTIIARWSHHTYLKNSTTLNILLREVDFL